MEIRVKKLNGDARVPKSATDGSACFDLYAAEEFSIVQGKFVKAKTGLAFEIPKGYFVSVSPRSSMGSRGIIIPNSPAVVDSDYRGEIMVPLYGLFCKFEVFGVGSRIAQARLVKCEDAEFAVVNKLSDTRRGKGGFGSSGK